MGFTLTGISTVSLFYLAAILRNDSQLDDKELAQRIKGGNQKAFRQFFKQQIGPLYRFLTQKGIGEEETQEVIQQAFVQLWENRHRIKPGSTLRSYLFKIAFNRFLNEQRTKRRKVYSDSSTTNNLEDQSFSSENPEEDTFHHQLLTQIETQLNELPEQQRSVFQLCFMEQLSYTEVAEILDIERKTVENHMGKALKTIREGLHDFL